MIDYKKLGFKCGVEIHQQLLTDKKLFCNCPAGKYTDKHDSEVLRHMRPTLSEFGTYDGTALMEFKTKKEIVYLLNKESVCTYEMDDTPPFHVNKQGLDYAIEIALMLGCTIVDEMHIIRKQYLDGSIPTGFQRTAIVGLDGQVPFLGRNLKIFQLGFEEDSCREVSNKGHEIVFRTDRLGMPLVEIVTAPEFKNPEEVREGIKLLGMVMRATGRVRRGAGSVRQDVNVSITGGDRVEIKGVSSYQLAEKLVHVEALRQKALLEIKAILKKKKLTKENLEYKVEDITKILRGTRFPLWKKTIEEGGTIRAIQIPGLSEVLSYPTQPTKKFIDELRGRVRVIACLDDWPILIHTANYPDYYEGYLKDYNKILTHFDTAPEADNPVIICAGNNEDTITAVNEIRDRIYEAMEGIPRETRRPLPSGMTDFERILPGPDRMYPDTDLPLTKISKEKVKTINSGLKLKPWEDKEKYTKLGLPEAFHERLLLSKIKGKIEALLEGSAEPTVVAVTMFETIKSLERKGCNFSQIDVPTFKKFFSMFADKVFYREHFRNILTAISRGQSLEDVVKNLNIDLSDSFRAEVKENIVECSEKYLPSLRKLSQRDKQAGVKREKRAERLVVGKVLQKIRNRYPAKEVVGMVKDYLKEGTHV